MNKDTVLPTLLITLLSVMVGNLAGDAGTLKDCATKGEAKMLGGGAITCEVKKEPKP